MRKILVFSLSYYPRFIGGAEVAVKEITDRISPGEIEFDMVALNGGGEPKVEKIGNVIVHRVFDNFGPIQKLFFPFAAFWKAVRLHRTKKHDAIWSIMANRAGFAAMFFKWTHRDVPFILTLQEGDTLDYPKKRAGIVYPLFKYIFRSADKITAISKFLADWARSMGAMCPISIVPNAVDYELFSTHKSPADELYLSKKLGKNESDIFLITTSRLVSKNAVEDIIDALKYLPANVKLLIIGKGPLEVKLKLQVVNMKLEDRVSFLGFVSHEEMPQYLHISDIFIRPSLSEGLGNSFLEAMAAGIPVIATPVGGIVDFLKDGETGLFCEVNNPESIARKVEKLIKDKESRDYIVKNARALVRERYQWGEIADKMKDIFMKSR